MHNFSIKVTDRTHSDKGWVSLLRPLYYFIFSKRENDAPSDLSGGGAVACGRRRKRRTTLAASQFPVFLSLSSKLVLKVKSLFHI